MKRSLFLAAVLPILPMLAAGDDAPARYRLADPGLKAVVIDSDERESFLGLQLDGAGRLFAGGREALFVYEPAPGGLYQPRQLLYRFPPDAWIYSIAIRGDDLYVATHTAIYLLKGGVKKRDGLEPVRLVWGLPMMPVFGTHQGLHALEFGPEGDLYFSNGDEIITYGDFKRPDHWSHWTYFHGTKGTRVTGCGGVFRISPDGEQFTVIAGGLRNPCGLAFDRCGNLFANDNDHESMPSQFVPGRLLHITPGAYFSWPRGWMPQKEPWRADLLDGMHPDLGRYVPTGMAYYDDALLPGTCRHSLYVAEWGRGKLLRYPLRTQGASFRVEQEDFLTCAPNLRPVGVAVGRGGRIFTSVCQMNGNEASPMYRSEIVMITRDSDAPEAPFIASDDATAPQDALYAQLADPSWTVRRRAQNELIRRGPEACRPAIARLRTEEAGSTARLPLLWLAAAAGAQDEVVALAKSPDAETRHQALRALAAFRPATSAPVFAHALTDTNPQVVQAALAAQRDGPAAAAPGDSVYALARGSDRLLRQAAVQLLAARLSVRDIRSLCEATDAANRRTGILVAGERLTVPPASGPLPADWPLDPMSNAVEYVGETVELAARGPLGNFTMADAWAQRRHSQDEETLFALLERRLHDSAPDNAKQAAFFLRLLKDPRTDAACATALGLPDVPAAQGAPLKGAQSTGITELPEAFKQVDWPKEVAAGDRRKGAELFNTRGCMLCHAVKPGDLGGGGPSLAGAGSRFNTQYFVESIITPNKLVSPIFRWTLVSKTDGTTAAGLITGETSSEIELLLPAGIRQTVKKADIAKREAQERSPMPEGLIQTPGDLRDLIAFLLSLKE